jgi:hypothetical protein
MHTVLQTVDKFSDLAKLFSKNFFLNQNNFANKFYYHKNLKNVIKTIFVVTAAETWQEMKQVGGGEWGPEVQINLMPPEVPKVNLFFPNSGSSGQLLVEGMIDFQIPFFILDMKKEPSGDISARRVLQTK